MNDLVYDSRDLFFKSPFGAVAEQTEVLFAVAIPLELAYAQPVLLLRDGETKQSILMEYTETKHGRIIYRCVFTPESAQVLFYHFVITWNDRTFTIKKGEGGAGILSEYWEGEEYQLTVYKRGYKTPDSLKGGIYYQIFPDRFYSSGKNHQDVPDDRILRSDWGGTPNFMPNEREEVLNNDYFGGDLSGIEQKLPYLEELGVTMVYLNPIFEAHSNHRYNVADYMKIDPLLGTEQDFVRLCAAAKQRGIRIILDGVFSHTGSDSIYFNKAGRYPVQGAYNSKESPYYSWFRFQSFPDRYQSWWGFHTLPEVDETDPSYIEFICGENGVIRHWLRLGASGYRLDVADELPDSFIEQIRKAVKAEGEENLLIGEVWEDASNKEAYGERRRYFLGDGLDSVMNYPFKNAILNFMVELNKQAFFNKIYSIVENYPPHALHLCMNSLSTHDTERAITYMEGESCHGKNRLWQSQQHLDKRQYHRGLQKLRAAMVLQYFLPGIPCIYYGDEAGLQGYKDPFNRACYPWGQENRQLIKFCKMLGNQRRTCPGLKQGSLEFLDSPDGIVVIKRRDTDGTTVAAVNCTGKPMLWEHNLYGYFSDGRKVRHNKAEIGPYDYILLTKQ